MLTCGSAAGRGVKVKRTAYSGFHPGGNTVCHLRRTNIILSVTCTELMQREVYQEARTRVGFLLILPAPTHTTAVHTLNHVPRTKAAPLQLLLQLICAPGYYHVQCTPPSLAPRDLSSAPCPPPRPPQRLHHPLPACYPCSTAAAPNTPAPCLSPPHLCCRPLDQAQRSDEGLRHALGGGGGGGAARRGGSGPVSVAVRPHADAEVLQGALRLGTPVPVRTRGGNSESVRMRSRGVR